MTAATLFTPKVRKGIVHLIPLIVVVYFLYISLIRHSDYPMYDFNVYTILPCIITFYLHTFILLPILLKNQKTRTYLFLNLSLYLIFASVFLWFEAVRSSDFMFSIAKKTSKPIDFLKIEYLISGSAAMLLLYIIGGVISFTYYTIIIDKKTRKKLVSFKHLELFVNLIVVGMFLSAIIVRSDLEGALISLIVITTFYCHVFFLVPLLAKRKKNIYIDYLILLSTFYLLTIYVSIYHSSVSYLISKNIFLIVGGLFLILFLSFIYGYFRVRIISNEKIFSLKLGAKESELSLLKSQVNPHFLFNTLNTLFGTALEENATKTAESTAKLASLIRYMQEDINKDFIPLDNEIKYLQDYIVIQKLRCAVAPEIQTKFINIENHKISPGLLIPFVENAFKYGIDPSKKSKLFVSVICDENSIHFECINSYDENFKTYYKEQGFGIGIKNAKERLELVYPKKHTFEVKKENNIFSVKINITVK